MPVPLGSWFDVFDTESLKPKLRMGAGRGEIAGPPGLGGMGPPGLGGGPPPGLGAKLPISPLTPPPTGGVGVGIGQPGAPPIRNVAVDPMAEARKRMALKPVTI